MVTASPQVASSGTVRKRYRYDLVDSTSDYEQLMFGLFESPTARFEGQDIAFLNLLCAQGIKGAENLDIKASLGLLDRLTADVKKAIKRNQYRYLNDPDYGHCEPMWKMAMLVTVVKLHYGAAYNPDILAQKETDWVPMDNARDVFINGLLDEDRHRRHGTCASIPVLVVAIGRRLGYPVGLAVAARHIIARWDGEGIRFNIEASNPKGMTIRTDEQYRREMIEKGNRADAVQNPYFFKTLTAVEEFALFMTFRSECLIYAKRYTEALHLSARALQYCSDDPIFTSWAITCSYSLIRQRMGLPTTHLLPIDPFIPNATDYLKPHERADYFTIIAHRREVMRQYDLAQNLYEEACRHRPHGCHEQHLLQRFIAKHNRPQRTDRTFPRNHLAKRLFQLHCEPHEQAHILMQKAHKFEAKGEWVKARDALLDLYMIDPTQSGVFVHARQIENRPEFQQQWNGLLAQLKRKNISTNNGSALCH